MYRPSPDPSLPNERLSDKLAALLRQRIEAGDWSPDSRLPTEQQLTEQFGVSRTVVREAVSRLKSMGMLTSRQGSGVFVAPRHQARPLAFDPTVLHSLESVLQVVEVRRTLEGEVAALAAQRITPEKARNIRQTLQALDEAVQRGEDGVEEDLRFHQAVVRATDNPHFERMLDFLEQYQRDAIKVTRANEATSTDFMQQVQAEHASIAQAVIEGRADDARQAAVHHMLNATRRIEQAEDSVKKALRQTLLAQPSNDPIVTRR